MTDEATSVESEALGDPAPTVWDNAGELGYCAFPSIGLFATEPGWIGVQILVPTQDDVMLVPLYFQVDGKRYIQTTTEQPACFTAATKWENEAEYRARLDAAVTALAVGTQRPESPAPTDSPAPQASEAGQ